MGRLKFPCPNCDRTFLTVKGVANHLSHPKSPCVGWAEASLNRSNDLEAYNLSNLGDDTDLLDNTTPRDQIFTDHEIDGYEGTSGPDWANSAYMDNDQGMPTDDL